MTRKRNFVVTFVLALALIAFATPATAQTPASTTTVSAAKSANDYDQKSDFWFINANLYGQVGCVSTYVNVYANDTTSRINGEQPTRTQDVQVYLQKYDTCTDTEIESAWGSAFPGTLTFKNGARVTGVVTVYDEASDSYRDVEIDLTFNPIDGTNDWNNKQGSNYRDFATSWTSMGVSQNATVSGTLRSGSESFMGGDQSAAVGSGKETYTYTEKKPKK